jgi:hypothetical protein
MTNKLKTKNIYITRQALSTALRQCMEENTDAVILRGVKDLSTSSKIIKNLDRSKMDHVTIVNDKTIIEN